MVKKTALPKKRPRPKKRNQAKGRRDKIAAAIAELDQINPPNAKVAKVIALFKSWLSDESGYDEEAWPELKKALDLERKRAGGRSLYVVPFSAFEGDSIMAPVPVEHTPDRPVPETVEERFRRLEATWTAEVGHFSSPTVLCGHPAFREIISLGEAVVPLMLHDLEERPRLWVWALPEISGTNPVPSSDRGKIRKMSAAWVRWGKENGYG